jgi:hypothetical protein
VHFDDAILDDDDSNELSDVPKNEKLNFKVLKFHFMIRLFLVKSAFKMSTFLVKSNFKSKVYIFSKI